MNPRTLAATILFVADVGEEGEGNLRGIRKLVDTYRKKLRYVIALDGAASDYITTSGLASRRVEITVAGPGGHSWSDFGAPNPIHALARGIARFVKTPVPDDPRTTFNVGSIEGGTSVNSIPAKATIKVDLRSEAESQLNKIEAALRDSIQAGIDEEMSAARTRGMATDPLVVDTKATLGIRPGGESFAEKFAAACRRARRRRLSWQPFAPRTLLHGREYSVGSRHPRDRAGRGRAFRRRSFSRRVVRSSRPRSGSSARLAHAPISSRTGPAL